LNVVANAAPSIICEGESAVLSAVASGGNPAYVYAWTPGGGVGSSQSVTPNATGNYSVMVTDANGCTAQDNVTLTVSPIPTPGFTADLFSGCAPVCINFSDTSISQPAVTINSWFWDFGDGGTSADQNPYHCYNDPGSFDVTLTVTTADGCSSTLDMPDFINSNPIPEASFTFSPVNPEASYPQVSFYNNCIGAGSWLWNFGDLSGSTSTLENPTFLFQDTSCFTVTLIATSDSGCVDTTSEVICVNPVVAVYVPNAFTPNGDGVNDVFMPYCSGLTADTYSLSIFNRWGQLVFVSDNVKTAPEIVKWIPLHGKSPSVTLNASSKIIRVM
jgi:PKD repeat protein